MTGRLATPPVAALAAAALLVACTSTGDGNTRTSEQSASSYNLQLGAAYLRQGNLALAKEKLERAAKQNPRDAEVHAALGVLYERLGNAEAADRSYETALRLAPRDPQVQNNYAVYLCRNGRTAEGVKRFDEAARNPLYRTPEAAYTNAAVCLRAAQRLDEAEQNLARALTVAPNYAEAAFQLADLQMERGRVPEARVLVDRFLANNRPTPELLLVGVRAARAGGDRLAEERFARQLRVEFPESEQARTLGLLPRNPG
jgi:type IV pilus assembly protein PilF